MKEAARATLLRIFVDEGDRAGSQPVYAAIVERARARGLSGATVFKGIEGYGGHAVVHAARIFELSANLPVLVEIVDTDERVRDFVASIEDVLLEGLVTFESVDAIRYSRGSAT